MSQRIFISSVQREFAKERKALAEYVRKDAILGRFFDVFLFEEVPAQERKADGLYKGYIEKSGTGTGDMIAKCASWGVPAPEWYEDDPDDFRVVLKRPVPEVGAGKMEQESRVKSSEKTRVKSRGVNYKKASGNKGERTQSEKRGGVKSRVESRVKSRVKIMSSAERIIAYLMANPEASAHELSIVVNLVEKKLEDTQGL